MLIDDIERYVPYNEQEEKDKAFILKALKENDDIFTRENKVMHMSASSWIVNQDFTKILMCYHKIYDSYSWTGGHADGDTDLKQVAIKEAKEETGIKTVKLLSDDIFSLEVLTVDGHIKKGSYVSSHLHLNVTYLLQADDRELLRIKEDENNDVRWFSIPEALTKPNEKWFVENIYSKLNKKLQDFIKWTL